MLSGQGYHVVVDFICPTKETRSAFGNPDKIIWMRRTPVRNFDDTTLMWEMPNKFDLAFDDDIELEQKIKIIIWDFKLHDWREPTTLMLGRYQPWHEGHHALYEEASKRTKQVMLGVRDTYKTSEKDPLKFNEVKEYKNYMNNHINTQPIQQPQTIQQPLYIPQQPIYMPQQPMFMPSPQ